MKIVSTAALVLALVAFCGSAFGQDINSTSNSQVSSGATSSAANLGNNQGQAITFNSPAVPTHTTQTVRAAPSMGLGSFGTSFSSDNCANTIAGQVSVIGVGASMGKALLEQNCAHLRRGYAFGQAAAFAAANHQQDLAIKLQAMTNYEFCTSDGVDSDTAHACEDMGLIKGSHSKQDADQVSYKQASAVERQQEPSSFEQRQVISSETAQTSQNVSAVHTGYNQSGTTGH
jgi:hypothetical protein